jgi:hypothetical protein
MLKKRVILKFHEHAPGGLVYELAYLIEHVDALAQASKADFKFEEGKTYFYLPDVSIPRFKLKATTEALNVKSTRSSEKADYIFMGPVKKNKSSDNLSNAEVTYKSYYRINDDLHRFDQVKNFSTELDSKLNEIALLSTSYDILIDHDVIDKLRGQWKEQYGKWLWMSFYTTKNFISLKHPSLLSKLRHQDDLIDLVNKDSIVITDEKMKDLQGMFDSKDNDNIVLAMEIMANSNFEESILNNYFLLINNLAKISQAKESSHRNFQNFMLFYGLDLRHLHGRIRNSDVDYISSFLKEYGKLTQEAMNKILKMYADTNSQYIGKYCNSRLVANTDVEYDEFE